jgi:hypothetical protein
VLVVEVLVVVEVVVVVTEGSLKWQRVTDYEE